MSGEGVHNVFDPTEVLEDLANIQADIDLLEIEVDAIRAQTDAEAVLEETGGTLTTDGTEQVLYISIPAGVFEPVCLKIDFTNHTATETIILRTYYRIDDGGGLIQQDEATYIGLVSPELLDIELEPNRFGVQVTIEKTAGTNRAYTWEVFYKV